MSGTAPALPSKRGERLLTELAASAQDIRKAQSLRVRVFGKCIAPEYRQGEAIAILWSGLAGFVRLLGFDYLLGCASASPGTDNVQAAAIVNRIPAYSRHFIARAAGA